MKETEAAQVFYTAISRTGKKIIFNSLSGGFI
jgi:hypothetical protein